MKNISNIYRECKIISRPILKSIIDLVCLLLVLPLFYLHWFMMILGSNNASFSAFSQFLSLIPGLPGCYLRKNFYRLAMTRCHKECAILFGSIFSQVDTEIGKGVYIGAHCNIGKCRIEDYCTIGSSVHIMSGKNQHNFDNLDIPIQEQGGVFKKVTIGEDTWIGNCALVMASVGKKCIIGAGSVVTKDIEDYSIAVGNPARVIKKREPQMDADEHG